jgi:hypothetical protein
MQGSNKGANGSFVKVAYSSNGSHSPPKHQHQHQHQHQHKHPNPHQQRQLQHQHQHQHQHHNQLQNHHQKQHQNQHQNQKIQPQQQQRIQSHHADKYNGASQGAHSNGNASNHTSKLVTSGSNANTGSPTNSKAVFSQMQQSEISKIKAVDRRIEFHLAKKISNGFQSASISVASSVGSQGDHVSASSAIVAKKSKASKGDEVGIFEAGLVGKYANWVKVSRIGPGFFNLGNTCTYMLHGYAQYPDVIQFD